MVVNDHLTKPFGSCPNFITLCLIAFVTIVVVPPGLYLNYHVMSISDVINCFLDQNFWIICCIDL